MRYLLWAIGLLQLILAGRVFARMARTSGGKRIERLMVGDAPQEPLSVLVPVLNEAARLEPCLDSLKGQGSAVREILVIDGGSTDGTQDLVREWARDDSRIRLIDAAPVPHGVNGKAFGLEIGTGQLSESEDWILIVDADVRLRPGAVKAIRGFAGKNDLRVLSVATAQRARGRLLGLVHPAMLTTLVYRFGIPGRATTSVDEVQANGQCFLVQRAVLERAGGFEPLMHTVAEDVALARTLAAMGEPVGFYECDDLVDVEMHADAADAWHNWPRSLPLPERLPRWRTMLGLAEVLLIQAAPLFLLPITIWVTGVRSAVSQLQAGLLMARLGVLVGTSRAYREREWSYWLSPLADLPVAVEIIRRSRRATHSWRGRTLIAGGSQ